MKKIPHTFVIIFAIIAFAAILTWVIPSGEYAREKIITKNGLEREIINPNSFHYVEKSPQTWQIFTSIFGGFSRQAEIILFVLMVGGAFWILNLTKAINVGILAILNFIKKAEKINFFKKLGVNSLIMIVIMTTFSLFGAIFGLSEETIAFVIILIPLAIAMGYDSITGLCLVYVAAHVGFAGAIFNPFTIGIAQGLSELIIFSGWEYRCFCWLIINIVAFSFILLYAKRIKKNPERSITYSIDNYWRNKIKTETSNNIEYYKSKSSWISFVIVSVILILFSVFYPISTLKIGNMELNTYVLPIASVFFILISIISLRKSVHFYILNLLFFTIVFLLIGVIGYSWYVVEIGALFLAMSIAAGIAANFSANIIAKEFINGAKDIFSAAFIIGLAGGIIVILENGKIIDTIMYALSNVMRDFRKEGSLGIMYCIQTCLNIIIPSGSAKAALTIPIMAPFSDLINISRQSSVLAFQFGDGFTNMITPASGVLIGCLGIAKIPYNIWCKFIWKFILLLFILGFLLLLPTIYFNFNGF